jgi:hypothetical protein
MSIKSLTLTHAVLSGENNGKRFAINFATVADAESYRDRWDDRKGVVVAVESTYSIGTAVQVQAFGKWREGTVTGLGRTKVKVRYIRSMAGTVAERTFDSSEVRLAA